MIVFSCCFHHLNFLYVMERSPLVAVRSLRKPSTGRAPLCFVPSGNIQGGSPELLGFNPLGNLWNGVTQWLSQGLECSFQDNLGAGTLWLISSTGGKFALHTAELTQALETAQLPSYHGKQNIPRGAAASLGQHLPVPNIPLPKISELLAKSLPGLSSVWAETERLLLGIQSGACLHSSLRFSANMYL